MTMPFGGFRIPPWLNEDVEHDTVLIHRAPKIMPHTLDSDEHLIEAPLVPGPRQVAVQAVGKALAEVFTPPTHRLIGDDNASFSQKQLDIPQAAAEHVVQ